MARDKGCALASTVFLADLPNVLSQPNTFSPKMNGINIKCLLYADDLVIFDLTRIGLQRKLDIFAD